MTIELRTGQIALARLWLIAGGMILAIFVWQTFTGHYGDGVNRAWGWILQALMPTLSLVVGGLVYHLQQQTSTRVDQALYGLARSLSAAYLLLLLAVLLVQPMRPLNPMASLEQSSLFLGPAQGIVTLAIGVFFSKQSDRK
jgi:hypothetical protein